MRITGFASNYNSGVDKFASSAIYQKYTDTPGVKAGMKNLGYNAVRYLSTLTVVPMAIAAVKKHSHRKVQPSSQFFLEINGKEVGFKSLGLHSLEDFTESYGKFCFISCPEMHLQYQGGKKTMKKLQAVVSGEEEPLYLARLVSHNETGGFFNLMDNDNRLIENPHPYQAHGPHCFALDLNLISLIEL